MILESLGQATAPFALPFAQALLCILEAQGVWQCLSQGMPFTREYLYSLYLGMCVPVRESITALHSFGKCGTADRVFVLAKMREMDPRHFRDCLIQLMNFRKHRIQQKDDCSDPWVQSTVKIMKMSEFQPYQRAKVG